VFGSDGLIDGRCESTLNTGWGLHVLSSGDRFVATQSDHNTGGGVYFDGRTTADWRSAHTYRIGSKILPTANNAGGFNFYVISTSGGTATCTSGASEPGPWYLAGGASIKDGTCIWGNGNVQSSQSFGNVYESAYVDDNCTNEFRIEGDAAHNAYLNTVSGIIGHANGTDPCGANGLYLLYAINNTVSNLTMLGSAASVAGGCRRCADTGGIVLEDSLYNVFAGITMQYWHKNPILLANNSHYNNFTAVSMLDTADATTSSDDAFCIHLSKVNYNSFSNIHCNDVRSKAYSKGFSNASGTGNRISGYSWITSVASPNVFGSATGYYTDPVSGNVTFLGTLANGSGTVPTVRSPTVGQATCVKSSGPPVVIGYCSTAVGAGGACTCN
jgi:hypothetical protein